MTQNPEQPKPNQLFDEMLTRAEPIDNPGYLQYWDDRVDEHYYDARLRKIVNGLTDVAIRGMDGEAEYTDKEPALQARYWYRALGPLNPMADVEPDLIQAAKMMYGKESPDPKESANLQLDGAYALYDLALAAQNPRTRHQSLMLGLQSVQRIKGREGFERQPGMYRLQTAILEGDVRQGLLRSKLVGGLGPQELPHETYGEYEMAYAQQELAAIGEFGKYVKEGITDENFGVLFEWYFVMAERFKSWENQKIDTQVVRGATSRENAEWTGEDTINLLRITGNHDVVVNKLLSNGRIGTKRYQMKAVIGENIRQYDRKVTVIDYQAIFKDKFRTIDSATGTLVQQLRKFQGAYRGSVTAL